MKKKILSENELKNLIKNVLNGFENTIDTRFGAFEKNIDLKFKTFLEIIEKKNQIDIEEKVDKVCENEFPKYMESLGMCPEKQIDMQKKWAFIDYLYGQGEEIKKKLAFIDTQIKNTELRSNVFITKFIHILAGGLAVLILSGILNYTKWLK